MVMMNLHVNRENMRHEQLLGRNIQVSAPYDFVNSILISLKFHLPEASLARVQSATRMKYVHNGSHVSARL